MRPLLNGGTLGGRYSNLVRLVLKNLRTTFDELKLPSFLGDEQEAFVGPNQRVVQGFVGRVPEGNVSSVRQSRLHPFAMPAVVLNSTALGRPRHLVNGGADPVVAFDSFFHDRLPARLVDDDERKCRAQSCQHLFVRKTCGACARQKKYFLRHMTTTSLQCPASRALNTAVGQVTKTHTHRVQNQKAGDLALGATGKSAAQQAVEADGRVSS